MNISQLMEVTLSFFTITICCFVSIFLLTTVQLETSKNEEQKRRLLNILYSHISILWQIDTLFCSAKVMIQVVSYVKDQDVQNIINQITDFDFLLGGLYFCSISIIRSIKHFSPDFYLDISYEYNGHWILPINICTGLGIKIVEYFTCSHSSEECYLQASEILFVIMTLITISLHGTVAIDIFCRKYFTTNQVLPFNSKYHDDLIQFSPGSSVFLLLAIYLGLLIMIFHIFLMPLTNFCSSLLQLVNITAISMYWTISQDNLRHRAETNFKKFFFKNKIHLLLLFIEFA